MSIFCYAAEQNVDCMGLNYILNKFLRPQMCEFKVRTTILPQKKSQTKTKPTQETSKKTAEDLQQDQREIVASELPLNL